MNNHINTIGATQNRLFDSEYWRQQYKRDLPTTFKDLRRYRALKIPKGISKELLRHENYVALIYWLSLKSMFKSSQIHNRDNKIPYQYIADFLDISLSGCRAHIKTLKELELLEINSRRDIVLKSYKTFCSLFDVSNKAYKHKHFIYNNPDIKTLIRAIVLAENQNKQKYRIYEKLVYLNSQLSYTDFIKGKSAEINNKLVNFKLEQPEIKRFKKCKKFVNNNFDSLLQIYKRRFKEEIKSKTMIFENHKGKYQIWKPYFDCELTMSCKGLARLLNRKYNKSGATGHYQQNKMKEIGLLNVVNRFTYSNEFATFWEFTNFDEDNRTDARFNRPRNKVEILKGKEIPKYIIQLTNVLELNFNL